MSPPTVFMHARQILGRALRETGQALDRVGLKTTMLATTPHDYYDDPVIYQDHLSRHRQQFPLLTSGRPVIHPDVAYLAPCATLIGTVVVGKGSSVWYGAVLRGDYGRNVESHQQSFAETNTEQLYQTSDLDENRSVDRDDHLGGAVYIGEDTNIQDGCVISARKSHCEIGDGVTVGHLAQLHSCQVQDFCLIGMGSVLNDGVTVERESLVAAGAVVPANTTVGSGELWVGNPARKLRDLSTEERQRLHYQSSEYVNVAGTHKHVEELGGNVDPESGASVFIVAEKETVALDNAAENVDEPLSIAESTNESSTEDISENLEAKTNAIEQKIGVTRQ